MINPDVVNPVMVEYAADLLRNRTGLHLETPIAEFIGTDPTPVRLTEAALAITKRDILLPYISALLVDPSGTAFDSKPAFMLVAEDEQGQIEGLHALTLALGPKWDVRLHAWMEGRRFTEDPHTHDNPFGSVVIVGSFADEVLIRAGPGEIGRPYVEWLHGQADPLGKVALRSFESRFFEPGEYHTMPGTLIHSAKVNPRGISATVVVRHFSGIPGSDFTSGPPTITSPHIQVVNGLDTLRRVRAALKDM